MYMVVIRRVHVRLTAKMAFVWCSCGMCSRCDDHREGTRVSRSTRSTQLKPALDGGNTASIQVNRNSSHKNTEVIQVKDRAREREKASKEKEKQENTPQPPFITSTHI